MSENSGLNVLIKHFMLRDLYAVYTESLGHLDIDFGSTKVFTWTYLLRPKHLGQSSLDLPLMWFSDRFDL